MEGTIRLSVFMGMLLIIMVCERLWPRRQPSQPVLHRWSINLGLVTLNSVLQRLLLGIHHSVIRSETDSNFGFSISCWDRWFGSYCSVPEQGQLGMKIGLPEYRDAESLNLLDLLVLPVKKLDRMNSSIR